MNFTYYARRSLIAGHVDGVQYAASFATLTNSRQREVSKNAVRSLSGKIETLYFYGERRYRITFAPVHAADLAALREMLDSTESGEPFTATVNGDALAAVTVKRTDGGYTLSEYIAQGSAPLSTDYFTADIEVTEA